MNTLSQLFDIVIGSSLRCTLLIGLWLLARPLLRGRVPAYLIFAAWVVIGLRLLIPVAAPARWSPYNVAETWIRMGKIVHLGGSSSVGMDLMNVSPTQRIAGGPSAAGGRVPVFVTSPHRNAVVDTKAAFIWAWAMGVAGLALLRVRSLFVFRQRVKREAEPPDAHLAALVRSVATGLKITASIEIVVSRAVPAPSIAGWWTPTLFFPSEFASQLSPADLRWVALHELCHWKRRDCWAHALVEWGRILHWFNPLVWLSARVARFDCELACDECVIALAEGAEPADYGAALVRVLARVRVRPPALSVVGILENKKQLKQRIHMIAKYRASTFGYTLGGGIFVALLTLIGATQETLAQPATDMTLMTNPNVQTPSLVIATQSVPNGWYLNGTHPKSYAIGLDASEIKVAPVSSYIKSVEPEIPGFGGMMQSFEAKDYRGKRVQFSAWIKTADVSKSANIWMRVDGATGILRFDNIQNRAPKGTQNWEHFAAVLDVPQDASAINIGFFVAGTGQAWFNDAKIDVVDASTPESDMPIPRPQPKQIPSAPQNLSFEAGLSQ